MTFIGSVRDARDFPPGANYKITSPSYEMFKAMKTLTQ